MTRMFTNQPDGTLWLDKITNCIYEAKGGEWFVTHQFGPEPEPPPPPPSIRQTLAKSWQCLFGRRLTFKIL